MTEQERLEEIDRNKELNMCGVNGKLLSIELSNEDYSYLYTQAERVGELEEELECIKQQIEKVLEGKE